MSLVGQSHMENGITQDSKLISSKVNLTLKLLAAILDFML